MVLETCWRLQPWSRSWCPVEILNISGHRDGKSNGRHEWETKLTSRGCLNTCTQKKPSDAYTYEPIDGYFFLILQKKMERFLYKISCYLHTNIDISGLFLPMITSIFKNTAFTIYFWGWLCIVLIMYHATDSLGVVLTYYGLRWN